MAKHLGIPNIFARFDLHFARRLIHVRLIASFRKTAKENNVPTVGFFFVLT
jgi:hypothetical protein